LALGAKAPAGGKPHAEIIHVVSALARIEAFAAAHRSSCFASVTHLALHEGSLKSAVEATRTHVSKQDLTTRQWIDIALTKLPRSS
jgi:hypothetical protein